MLFVWRGIGIIVPIIFFIVGWIVSFWIKDSRIGNAVFMGWTSFYSAIVLLLLGIVLILPNEDKSAPKKRHDFFFIPVIIWAFILGGLSAWLLIGLNVKKEEESVFSAEDLAPRERVLHIFNPTSDTLFYVVSDKFGFYEKEKLEPYTALDVETPKESYLLAGINLNGESTLALPGKKDFDLKKYEKVKEDNDFIYQRILPVATKALNDYDEPWMLLSSGYDMSVIDVSSLYEAGNIVDEKIKTTNWTQKIYKKYEGNELIETMIAPAKEGQKVTVIPPYTYLPLHQENAETVYLLLVHPFDTDLTNEYIEGELKRLLY